MDEIVKSIKSFLYDRTVSPLFGAYFCAWSVWNYRVFVALLDGDATLEEKMTFIDKYFGVITYDLGGQIHFVWGQIIHGLLGPTLLTLIYLYVYPRLAKPVYEYSLEKQKELRDIKQKNDELRLLTHEQSRELIKEIEQLRQKSYEESKQYRERIASLTETINILEEENKNNPTVSTSEQFKTAVPNELKNPELEAKFELAKAYIGMGDMTGARELIDEIMPFADTNQRRRAKRLINKLENNNVSTDKEPPQSKQVNQVKKIELTQDEKDLLKILIQANDKFIDWFPEYEILKTKNKNVTDIKIALGDLKSRELIKRDYRGSDKGYAYQLTIEGMKASKNIT